MTTHTFMLQLCLHCINLSARLIFSSEWRRILFSAGFCVEIYKYMFYNTTIQKSGVFGGFLCGYMHTYFIIIILQKIGDMRLGETRFRTCSMKSQRRTAGEELLDARHHSIPRAWRWWWLDQEHGEHAR